MTYFIVFLAVLSRFAPHAPPPGIPTVRAFQAAQGRVAISWLRERSGWD